MKKKVVIGTRGSRLALVQTDIICNLLQTQYPDLFIERIIIKTKGDIIQDTPLAKIGDKGLFTKEIEDGLLNGIIDLAVHSMKDLPTKMPKGLKIVANLEREDPRDAFISHKFKSFIDLPNNSVVATSSLRRKANILMHRPDLKLVDIRGNVDTRLKKLIINDYDGMLLAVAGLKRLGYENEITEVLDHSLMMPAVAQGALGIEIRENDSEMHQLLAPLHHNSTGAAVTAERSFLKELEGGCQVPIGALAQVDNSTIKLAGTVSDINGKLNFKGSISGNLSEAEQLGKKLAQQLIKQGAKQILEKIYREERNK